jgi:hypothetical protein
MWRYNDQHPGPAHTASGQRTDTPSRTESLSWTNPERNVTESVRPPPTKLWPHISGAISNASTAHVGCNAAF